MTKTSLYLIPVLLLALLFAVQTIAQESALQRKSLNSCGSQITGNSIAAQQTIGQVSALGTHKTNQQTVRQGFLQPLISLSDSENAVEINVEVYPNPFSTEFSLELDSALEGLILIQLFDLTGRLVKETSESAAGNMRLNCSNLETGIYLLYVRHGENTFSTKIQKSS